MLITNTLFHTDAAQVFKIPPGSTSLLKWNTSKVVWSGSMRLVEQEDTDVADSAAPHTGLRLKLELYNREHISLLLEDFSEIDAEVPWAEVWYNPFAECDVAYAIANDGSDTIAMTAELAKYYKIITQIPGTGYHPLQTAQKGSLLQVALGLKFEDSFSAVSFLESLATYKRHFRKYQDKYSYDKHLSTLQQKIRENLRMPLDDLRENTPSDYDDDDFGNFVGASYD